MSIKIYRLGKTKYGKDLSGEGARLAGGRWNSVGTPMVYASENSSLAFHEMLFQNVNLSDINRIFSILIIEVPAIVAIETFTHLPTNWAEDPHPSNTRKLGDEWALSKRSLLLKVPSSLIQREYNYLINPLHPDLELLHDHIILEKFPVNEKRYRSLFDRK